MSNPNDGHAYFRYANPEAPGSAQFSAPYGLSGGPMTFAMDAIRYQGLFGATRQHIATFVTNSRSFGSRFEHAYYFDSPLSVDDYMNEPIMWEPYSKFDFAFPVDGVSAIVLTRSDRAADLRQKPAYVTGWGQSGWMNGSTPAENMWATAQSIGNGIWRTSGLGPNDVDGAMLYDGYSYDVYFWLEGMGFCNKGEAFEYIQDGRIALGGKLPLNTFGGNLSQGRLHGLGHLIEACMQVTDRAGDRQIAGARNIPVTIGPNSVGTGFMISKDPL
jgi:acetyl-CoA acetyltransferase